MAELRQTIRQLVQSGRPMTCRQVFYRLVSMGVIDKSEGEYKRTVCRLLKEMRLSGDIPWRWIVDNTRLIRKPDSYNGLGELMEESAALYRRDLWRDAGVHIEIWIEKDALAGIAYDVTARWDVPLMAARGFSSLSFLHETAETIIEFERPAYIYHFGDHDPSGIAAAQQIETRLREFAPGAQIHFERVAVTEQQIHRWDLPTRPTKKTDPRAKTFKGESVELDAVPPADLRRLIDDCIERHVDDDLLHTVKAAEESERDWLRTWANAMAS